MKNEVKKLNVVEVLKSVLDATESVLVTNKSFIVIYSEVVEKQEELLKLIEDKRYNISTQKRYKAYINNICKLAKADLIDITSVGELDYIKNVRDLHTLVSNAKKELIKVSEALENKKKSDEERVTRLQTSKTKSKADHTTVNNEESVADTDSKSTVTTVEGNIVLTIEAYKALDKSIKDDLKKELITALDNATPSQMVQLLQAAMDAALISI